MSPKLLVPLFALAVLLSACGSTVITEEDRVLPENPLAAVEKSSVGSQGYSSSNASVFSAITEGTYEERAADLSQSFIAFTGSKGDIISHEGKFENIDFSITLTDSLLTDLTITIGIDSIVADPEKLTNHLKSSDFFDAATFSEAVFVAESFVNTGGDEYAITGTLSLHGVSKKEIINATITQQYLTTNFTIDRTAYGIGAPPEGLKAIDAAVPMEVKVVFL